MQDTTTSPAAAAPAAPDDAPKRLTDLVPPRTAANAYKLPASVRRPAELPNGVTVEVREPGWADLSRITSMIRQQAMPSPDELRAMVGRLVPDAAAPDLDHLTAFEMAAVCLIAIGADEALAALHTFAEHRVADARGTSAAEG